MKDCRVLEELQAMGCKLFKANVWRYDLKDNSVLFEDENEYMSFIKYNEIKSVFYYYSYYDKDEYVINGAEVDEYIIKSVSKLIKERNSIINSLDFNIPRELSVFALYEGKYISFCFYDNWLAEMSIEDSTNFIEMLECKYEEILEENRKKHKDEVLTLKDELKEIILNDFNFKICTNKELRKNYADNIRRERKYRKYESCFYGGYKKGNYKTDFDFFIELTWAEYKEIKKEKINKI